MRKRRFHRKRRGGKKSIIKFVKRELKHDLEVKQTIAYQNPSTGTGSSQAGTLVFLHLPGQGALQQQRVGNVISIRKFELRFFISAGSPTAQQSFRIIMFRDLMTVGSAPLVADLLALDGNAADNHMAAYNINNRHRFKILADKRYDLIPEGGANDYAVQKKGFIRKNYSVGKEAQIHFNNANSGTVADVESGSIYLLYLTDVGSAPPFVWYGWSLWYTDA